MGCEPSTVYVSSPNVDEQAIIDNLLEDAGDINDSRASFHTALVAAEHLNLEVQYVCLTAFLNETFSEHATTFTHNASSSWGNGWVSADACQLEITSIKKLIYHVGQKRE